MFSSSTNTPRFCPGSGPYSTQPTVFSNPGACYASGVGFGITGNGIFNADSNNPSISGIQVTNSSSNPVRKDFILFLVMPLKYVRKLYLFSDVTAQ